MSVVLERNGAQILPPIGDECATVTAHAAQQCANADHRVKFPVYADLARRLVVRT